MSGNVPSTIFYLILKRTLRVNILNVSLQRRKLQHRRVNVPKIPLSSISRELRLSCLPPTFTRKKYKVFILQHGLPQLRAGDLENYLQFSPLIPKLERFITFLDVLPLPDPVETATIALN